MSDSATSKTQDNTEQNNAKSTEAAEKSITLSTEEHAKLVADAEKFKSEYLYLRAEFENYRRNSIKERSDLSKFGGEKVIKDLLEVVDNFDRALELKITSENFETFAKGIQMTSVELKHLLIKNSVTEIPCEGHAFDPSVHEALSSEPTDKFEPGFISRVFKKAYKLHDKILRPAQVIVAKKPE